MDENPIFEMIDNLGHTRRIDGEFCWKDKMYKYSGYTIVPKAGNTVIRIDIKEKKQ